MFAGSYAVWIYVEAMMLLDNAWMLLTVMLLQPKSSKQTNQLVSHSTTTKMELFGNFSKIADPPPFWEPLVQKEYWLGGIWLSCRIGFLLRFTPFLKMDNEKWKFFQTVLWFDKFYLKYRKPKKIPTMTHARRFVTPPPHHHLLDILRTLHISLPKRNFYDTLPIAHCMNVSIHSYGIKI